MGDLPGNSTIARLPAGLGLTEPLRTEADRSEQQLLIETVVLTVATVLLIRLLVSSSLSGFVWFLCPTILVAAALVPAIIRKESFTQIVFSTTALKRLFPVLAGTCLIVFPLTFAGLWLLKSYGLEAPLRTAMPQNQRLLSWVCYQFLYVAVAEEIFFRGYLQSNLLKILKGTRLYKPSICNWTSIVLSAVCFAVAHVIVQGRIVSAMTFFPGLILGWLFIRTRTLLAPILFHGLANTCYCLMTLALI